MSSPLSADPGTGAPGAVPFLVAVGDPLIALMPSRPVGIEHADELQLFTGGAEVNAAIGVRRLGVSAAWLGRVGDDPLGRRVVRALEHEGVDTSLVVVDRDAPTGLYLREWLPDGVRRPYYYRHAGAGARLSAGDWPESWPATLPRPTVLHVTGITVALSETAAEAVRVMIGRARALGCAVSVDPNHRAPLWSDSAEAHRALRDLVAQADVLLLSEEDAQVLFGTTDPQTVLDQAGSLGPRQVVLKRGARGAFVGVDGTPVEITPQPALPSVDPVGAGDGFDAGYLAATMLGIDPIAAARCGAWCGARAVEQLGEHTGYPTRAELPTELAALFTAADALAAG
jgi:2-dehydro-3-deoxygluconokinase